MSDVVKKDKRSKDGISKPSKKDSKKDESAKKQRKEAAAKAFTLLADEKAVDPTLSSLFSVRPVSKSALAEINEREDVPEGKSNTSDGEVAPKISNSHGLNDTPQLDELLDNARNDIPDRKRKRKRRDADENLEAEYLDRLARDDERDAVKRRKGEKAVLAETEVEEELPQPDALSDAADDDAIDDDAIDDDAASPPPQHETQQTADENILKANRTVFLGNVATSAITSKAARKTLLAHLASFFDEVSAPKDEDTKHKIESIRFRSTPYATAIPKKAAFARKEVMDATTKSTNAYVIYSSTQLAREAAKRLNGTTVLDRHLRVDEIAHPAVTDHRRCVFVGNLGFVDDESNIQQANEDEGREVRKRGKEPSDVEEGLWRTFSRCGTVESVRVIRDSTTRVGKGIAYVQFDDPNAVEAALLYNEKKFPPMLPRKLRVTRAKAVKRNAKPDSGRPTNRGPNSTGYQRKVTGEERSQAGRAGKLFGRAGAANMRKPPGRGGRRGDPMHSADNPNNTKLGDGAPRAAGIKRPEDFVFEGHRASNKSGKTGLKLGGKSKGKSKGKPTTRSSKRGTAFKAGAGRKKTG
ncbi:Nucleolar protein 12 [Friedmanniomyces endolithicus]|uniref:Nucleolar protein 12 n=1 Tax=Friedmanniomyces endolithicus TaxID=329885 RepID=A0A4U0U6E5_9PEZI|nr:Nucleolar protein 12 [Friedmanniomyces endolithicus]KAK0267581.1 Nucleolar protein 12 [Friedmanniomyces endolithicus]KAK0297826.1 Nucleolar protein 12 [Friedmanniomyces endolithicus]KAK0306192.1 Nucleolar protein 12 [Friedmanniomyces endolithicus]KAK0909123.1 Nucleolar protein 12 [Friedmanniomyces endolithicus]